MPTNTDPIEDLDFRFVDPSNYEDDVSDGSISEARKQALVNEAVEVAQQAWVSEVAAANDEARATALGTIPPPPKATDDDDDPEDPFADKRAEQERYRNSAASLRERAAAQQKSFSRKKKRLADAGVTITPNDLKNARKVFLVGQTDQQGQTQGGYLRRLEEEFISHRQRRRRALKAIALTGVLALNEQEKAQMEQQAKESEEAMKTLKELVLRYRTELKAAGGNLPTKGTTDAPVGESENRESRRATGKRGSAKLSAVKSEDDE
jgi:hypothetical protein